MKRLLVSVAVVLAIVASAGLAQMRGTFIFVKVNESIMPIPRGEKYEDPLDAALRKERLGSVTGAGSQLSAEGKVIWIGLDVELIDLSRGIPFLKKTLIELGAPPGSVLQFEQFGRKVEMPLHESQ